MGSVDNFPAHFGLKLTKTFHTKAEGPTLPENNRVKSPFVVLVTGAGKGLGFHISLAYARAGASGIIIASRTKADLAELSDQLRAVNPHIDILARTCDTTKDADVKQLAAETKSHFGRLDVAVANAGVISKYKYDGDGQIGRLPLGIVEDDDFERVIDINFLGSYRVAKHFVPLLIETRDGPQAYIVITSLACHIQDSTFTPVAYNVSKIAVDRMAEHIHNDHYEKDGVVAFAVHPGAVVTPQTEQHNKTNNSSAWDDCEFDIWFPPPPASHR